MKVVGFAEKNSNFEYKDTEAHFMISNDLAGKVKEIERFLEEYLRVLRSSGFLLRDYWASILKAEERGRVKREVDRNKHSELLANHTLDSLIAINT